ncbi:MAG: alpha-1,4-glucan--maltose-1-phosphate maltosyltransferase, partial [Terriglobales bacterium]
VIEAVAPAVDDGRFAVKRLAGDRVTVAADIFADGHEALAAALLWRPADTEQWQREPMRPVVNDRWEAAFTPVRVGRHWFAIEAWWDDWGTLRRDLMRKREADQDVTSELNEAHRLLHEIAAACGGRARAAVEAAAALVDGDEAAQRIEAVLGDSTRAAVEAAGHRPFPVRSNELPLDADRSQAGFASWYEMFPRSATRDPHRHGTFDDVINELPRIRDMGFDVLYFPPIHPVGHTNRKGRNNSLLADPDDVGSVYAIGDETGGHDAVLPALGSLADFRRLIEAARRHRLEIALDYAIQCSPDHPWLRQHPEWFRWRPDGTVRYAENPPKKYEDIVNVDFYAPAAIPDLWLALRDVVLFWADQWLRIFRVDNPHTKPFAFWQWLIAAVRARHPDAIFLSEAFTRPKVMHYLAKLGFSQSYTYFTWRNTKAELTDYLQELAHGPGREYFRPNFFANTPDILSEILQRGGCPAFLQRLVLAATLSPSYGIYSGFELCENRALPGTEEYADSEKYQFKVWDWDRPGNIKQEIARINDIRRRHPALARLDGLRFIPADNDQVLFYARQSPAAGELLLIAVNLDPFHPQSAFVELPLEELGLGPDESFEIDDLLGGYRGRWQGRRQWVRLDPAVYPAHVFQVRRQL